MSLVNHTACNQRAHLPDDHGESEESLDDEEEVDAAEDGEGDRQVLLRNELVKPERAGDQVEQGRG